MLDGCSWDGSRNELLWSDLMRSRHDQMLTRAYTHAKTHNHTHAQTPFRDIFTLSKTTQLVSTYMASCECVSDKCVSHCWL